jgi:hypothetical protein
MQCVLKKKKKKEERRNKKEETRKKKEETRNKKQETRNKKQERRKKKEERRRRVALYNMSAEEEKKKRKKNRTKKKKTYGLFVFMMANIATIDQCPVAQTPTHWSRTSLPSLPLGRCGTPILTIVLAKRFAIRFNTMKDRRRPSLQMMAVRCGVDATLLSNAPWIVLAVVASIPPESRGDDSPGTGREEDDLFFFPGR